MHSNKTQFHEDLDENLVTDHRILLKHNVNKTPTSKFKIFTKACELFFSKAMCHQYLTPVHLKCYFTDEA